MYSFLLFGIVSVQMSLGRVGLSTCTNKDCPEGYFCHEKICKRCLRCSLLFRKGNLCVTDFNECKDCLEGYEEILITDFSNAVKPCRPVKKKVKLKTCENDSGCPLDNYCNEESCVKCFQCSLLNRISPVQKCARGLNECGSCMIGYYELSVTTENNYKPCEKGTLVVPEIPYSSQVPFITFATFCAFAIAITAAFIIFSFKKFKDRIPTKAKYHRPIYPSAPPLHSVYTSQYVRKTDGIQPTAVGFIEEKKQQAKVFKQPCAYYYYRGEEVDELDNASPENNDEATHTSYTPSNRNESEEINCSSRVVLNDGSELALNELGMVSLAEESIGNTIGEGEPPRMDSVDFSVIDVPQMSDDSSDGGISALPENQNLNQEQT